MKISEFLRRGTLQIAGGVILNLFKMKKRRDTLYFGDIPARYFLLCEKNGFAAEVQQIGQKWMYLYFSTLVPEALRKLRPDELLNGIVKNIWVNMGLMSGFSMSVEDKHVTINTRDEGMSELIGSNSFLTGFHQGVLNALYGKEVEVAETRQTREECLYSFRILDKKFRLEGKGKAAYDQLNHIPEMRGLTLHDMLKTKVFYLRGKKLYFRGKIIYPIENTVLHLFGNSGILLDKVPEISYRFFSEILEKASGEEEKLRLLKNLLQAMGWGIFGITKAGASVKIGIDHPPYGLQKEKDNWDFLIRMMLGYLMAIDEGYAIEKINEGYKALTIDFSRQG
jgi:hypothetical protein